MKILFVYASAGAGHMKAAEALYLASRKSPQYAPTFVDILDYAHPSYKRLYRGSYSFLVSKIPFLWGMFFQLLDVASIQPAVRGLRRFYNHLNGRRFEDYLIQEQFDVIFSTHFMPNEVAAALKRKHKIKSKIICVITDYDVHKIWLAEGIDHYAVACEDTKEKCLSLGVDSRRITVTGIPTDEHFAQGHNIPELKKRLGLYPDVFTVLIATGSFGIGPIEEILGRLEGFQVIVICGHNKELFMRLVHQHSPMIKIFGLVDNMYEMMAVSDCMVTKPGGLSISEALVSQLPMIFFNAIPGQETNNILVLQKYGIGSPTQSVQEIVDILTDLKKSKDQFLTALKKTKALARPSAVKDILSLT